MGRALVLNVSDQPLAVVTAHRAVVLVLKDKAEVVESNGMVFHAERLRIEAPSVVRLR
jgi:tRNA-binding EMAP/Myf-like protein